jgi:predicted RNA-binding protein with PIN domain
MSVHIIIDGYNLIRQSSQWSRLDIEDMQLGREALLKTLAEYKKKKAHRITVVFDAAEATGIMERNGAVGGISVKVSSPGQSADTLIKRMAAELREKALVVSSDRDIVDHVSGLGAAVIGSPDSEMKISLALWGHAGDEDEENTGWRPTTRKKGPGRRLKKRQRRNRSKLEKL